MPFLSCSGSGSQVLHKDTDSVGPAFCALPRSEQLRQPGAWQVYSPRWAVRIITSPIQAPWFPGCAVSGVPQERPLRCIVCVLWGAALSLWYSGQMSTIQDPRKTWLATGSLLTVWWRMPVFGVEIAAASCLPFGCHPPASLAPAAGGPRTQPASSPLVFAQSFVLWVGQAAR